MKKKRIDLFGNNKIVPNTGIKYSKLLEQFMEPFMWDLKDLKYTETILDFSINTWNMANMNNHIPIEEVDKAMSSMGQSKAEVVLIKKMITYKNEKFKEYTNFIVDFELREVNDGGDPILSVITQEEEPYLKKKSETKEKQNIHGKEDFVENYVNRNAISLKSLEPFVDWFTNLFPDEDIQKVLKETNIYLVNEEIEDLEKWLKKKFDTFFMMELEEWCTDKKQWPQKRNYKMFKLWFRVETSEMIYDLEKKPVLKSE